MLIEIENSSYNEWISAENLLDGSVKDAVVAMMLSLNTAATHLHNIYLAAGTAATSAFISLSMPSSGPVVPRGMRYPRSPPHLPSLVVPPLHLIVVLTSVTSMLHPLLPPLYL